MENTRKFLASENVPEGVQLFPDSFRKGFISLVCPDGFVPNTLMSKCGKYKYQFIKHEKFLYML